MSFYNLANYGFWSIHEEDEFDRIAKLPYERGKTDCDYKCVLYMVALLKAGIPARVINVRSLRGDYHAIVEYMPKKKKQDYKYYADLVGTIGGHKYKKSIPDGWEYAGIHDSEKFIIGYIATNGINPDIQDAYEYLSSISKRVQ